MTSPRPLTMLDAIEALCLVAEGLCRPAEYACAADCCCGVEMAGGRIVTVTLPDMIALATYLRRPEDKQRALRQAVEELVERYCVYGPLTRTYMIQGINARCPFLDANGACTVYAVRPLLCRAFFHCHWIGNSLKWAGDLDERIQRQIVAMSQDMGRNWEHHAGLLWRQPWRYDEILLAIDGEDDLP